jgi:hypothetical protein
MLRKPPYDVQAARAKEKTPALSEVARRNEFEKC